MPLPGSSPSRAASQPSRASAVGSGSTPSRRLARASEPRTVRTGAPPAPSCSTTSSTTRCVGRRRRREHRPAGRQGREQVADAAVVGPEVVAPVADAVRLVDDQQAGGLGQPRQLLVAEARVVQPLRADQQQVDLAGRQRRSHRGPLVGVGGVHGHRAQAGPARGLDLVAHQREQRRHDQRRPAHRAPAAGRSPGSRPPTCPSRCAARRGPARRRRRAPRPPRAARRAARRPGCPPAARSSRRASSASGRSSITGAVRTGALSDVVTPATLAGARDTTPGSPPPDQAGTTAARSSCSIRPAPGPSGSRHRAR